MPVLFHSADILFTLKGKNSVKKWIISEISLNTYKTGQINIIFCSDDFLLEINKNFLKHNYYTDIITFNYNDHKIISGDLYISIDRVTENAIEYSNNFLTELNRVIIHGVFHLLGFEDNSDELKIEIHNMEDEALKRFSDNFN